MAQKLQDIEKRLSLYKRGNHILRVEIKKYSFDVIQREFDMKKNIDYLNTKVIIKYYDHIPQISNCAILNCANSDAVNAGYRIDHRVTQEGQLFHDSDVFASNLNEFYPFDFKNELLYATNVTFHNNASLQWDPFSLRTNDIIFATSKRMKNTYETEQLRPDLEIQYLFIEIQYLIQYLKLPLLITETIYIFGQLVVEFSKIINELLQNYLQKQ